MLKYTPLNIFALHEHTENYAHQRHEAERMLEGLRLLKVVPHSIRAVLRLTF